jgi:hypothetical protein
LYYDLNFPFQTDCIQTKKICRSRQAQTNITAALDHTDNVVMTAPGLVTPSSGLRTDGLNEKNTNSDIFHQKKETQESGVRTMRVSRNNEFSQANPFGGMPEDESPHAVQVFLGLLV